jgi:hypothetical protein
MMFQWNPICPAVEELDSVYVLTDEGLQNQREHDSDNNHSQVCLEACQWGWN